MKVARHDPMAIIENTVQAVLRQPKGPLGLPSDAKAIGVYVLYYTGDHEMYQDLGTDEPIYVGQGWLRMRLREHIKSLTNCWNLEPEDFLAQLLALPDKGWALKIERTLINYFHEPLWNTPEFFGFGNNGSERVGGKAAPWDVFHPGRPRADHLIRPEKAQRAFLVEKAKREVQKRRLNQFPLLKIMMEEEEET